MDIDSILVKKSRVLVEELTAKVRRVAETRILLVLECNSNSRQIIMRLCFAELDY